MNLLPKSHEEFSQTEYWNKFFKNRGKAAFEWYGEYPELCENLHKYIKTKDDIVVIGCGNSKLSSNLYDVGFRNITNIDISPIAIKQMNVLNKTDRPDMKFIQMDATSMTFSDEQFSVALDKGTLDALMTNNTDEIKESVFKYFSEIERVLKIAGRYVCISLLQEHILRILLEFFPNRNWMLRVVRCLEVEKKTMETNRDLMPTFMVICTKFKNLPSRILEINLGGEKINRVQTEDEITLAVVQAQKAAMICNGLQKTSLTDYTEICLDLFQPDNDKNPRFTIYVVDQKPARANGKFAAFIVPQGRETDWLFSTKQGRQKLLTSATFNRLAVISMHRGHTYKSWNDVKLELAESIKILAPHDLKDQIPYLSLGSEVGKRETIYCGKSEHSGDFIIEEISADDKKIFRRLIFLSNQFIIQSEALIKIVKGKKVIDFGYLACQHHLYMTVGVRAIIKDKPVKPKILVVGLGGGGLCTFLYQCLRNIQIIAVEIDSAMLDVAKNYFGLALNQNLKVEIEDGIKYLHAAAEQNIHFNSIIFDVDNKESSIGISCPPIIFLSHNIINSVKKCLSPNGIFILNLVCRDEILKENLIKDLKLNFKSICSYQVEEELNEILYCCDDEINGLDVWKNMLKVAAESVNILAKKNKYCNIDEDLISVEDYINDLKI